MRLLFVTWDGPGTSYHETLFLPLLARAKKPDDEVHVLQFTWDAADRSMRDRQLANRLGITFTVKTFTQQPSSLEVPPWILRGARLLALTARHADVDVILARSIIPGAMALLARPMVSRSTKFIYDADGLMADERAEFGGWHRYGLRYPLFTAIERAVIRRSERVLVRTSHAAQILRARAGVDLERFQIVTNARDERAYTPGNRQARATTREALGVPLSAPLLAYAGSIGPQYQPRRMMALFHAVVARRPDVHFLVLTPKRNHSLLMSLCLPCAREQLRLREAAPDEVPKYLAAADVGIALRQPSLSQRAVSPIKVAEYLLCGLPVVYSPTAGNLAADLGTDVAYPLDPFSHYAEAAEWIVEKLMPRRDAHRIRAREKGVLLYSLDRGARDYATALSQ